MGKGKDRPNLRHSEPRLRPARKTSLAKLAALAALGLAFALASPQPPSPLNREPRTPNPAAGPSPQAPNPAPGFDRARAWKDLVTQVDFGPRKPGTAAHRACRDYLVDQLKASCENVHLVPFQHVWSRTGETMPMWNIVGEQNWQKSSIHVLLMAHWDSRPTADMEQDPAKQAQPIPGADDGASGVAVLLELARDLKVSPAKVGVMYVLLDGEDVGPESDEMYLGARLLAKDLPTPKPDYGILLDMIANRGVRVPEETNSKRLAPTLLKDFYAFAAKIGMADTFPEQPGLDIEDDHLQLNEAGVPCIDLIDFNYPAWHTLGDTPDKCSPESLYKIGHILQEWLTRPEQSREEG